MEKSIDQKLKECKTVIIQNVQKTLQNTMIYRYLKEEKIENDVKKYGINTKDGFITLEFPDHEKARQYYDKANFKDKILIRPFNIYLNVQLNENEMKKYYIQGLTEDNMRKLFDIARKIGICKIYTSYTSSGSNAKLKPNGVLSFVRKEPISEIQFNNLKEQLKKIEVNIYVYNPDKGLKCAVYITDFYQGDLNDAEENIEKNAKQQIETLLKSVIKDFTVVASITPIVKRREVPNTQNKQGSKFITKVKAIVQIGEYDKAIKNFEEIRVGFINLNAKATLNFYNSEINSYISLFTSGLSKPADLSEKKFEDVLVQTFRKINPHVVQVNVFPSSIITPPSNTSSSNTPYIARVYLSKQDSGRDFIVDYDSHRQLLVKHYKSKENMKFNINIDDKTMKKMKQYESRAGQMLKNIKNDVDRNKINKPLYQMPLNPGYGGVVPPIAHIPGGGMMGPNKLPPHIMNQPPIPNQGQYPIGVPNSYMGMPPPNMGGMGMGMGMNMGMGMGMVNPISKLPQTESMRQKIEKTYARKAHFVDNCKIDRQHEETTKKQCFLQVRFVLQNDLKVSQSESTHQATKILQSNDIGTIIDFMKKPHELYSKVLKA